SRRFNDLTAQVERFLKEITNAEERLSAAQDDKNAAQTEEIQVDENILQLQSALSQQETRIEETNSLLKQLNNHCSEARSRYGVLEELQNKLTGYDSGVKAVLLAKQTEPLMWQEVLGVVANLISVDQTHESAVEALLGGQLQSLVVKNRPAAEKVIDYLKAEGQGKVSLFVLDDLVKLQGQGFAESVLSEPGVESSVLSLLKYNPEMEPVVRFLFEQDVFVKDLAAAEGLTERYSRTRFVTQEGDRLGPLGFIKAGSAVSGVSLMGRHREMSELAGKLKDLENQLQETESALGETKKQRKETEDRLLGAETRRQQLKIRLAEAEKEITQSHDTLARLQSEKTAKENEKNSLEEHWNTDKNRIQELNQLVAQSDQAHDLTQEEISEARRQLQELQAQKDEIAKQ
ncbi:MAG TPA: hypothetical protein VK859_17140, partial [bacterium]|nr:hypothetical protein [bacterium]